MVVSAGAEHFGRSLQHETYVAEATTRYYAGMYYSLRACMPILMFTGVALVVVALPLWLWPDWSARLARGLDARPDRIWPLVHAALLASLYWAFRRARHAIMLRFRQLRLKEVETVYTAFYLVSRAGSVRTDSQAQAKPESGSSERAGAHAVKTAQ